MRYKIGEMQSVIMDFTILLGNIAKKGRETFLGLSVDGSTATRDGYDQVARLGKAAFLIQVLILQNGEATHSEMETWFSKGFTGKYPSAFKTMLSTKINPEFIPLDIEIVAERGYGWKIRDTHES